MRLKVATQNHIKKSLNTLSFVFGVLILISILAPKTFAAIAAKPTQIFILKNITDTKKTEASTCIDCKSRLPQSSLSEYLSQLPIVKDNAAKVYDAAYFDDGNDKKSIVELRKKAERGDRLTDEEKAILQAANRTGWVYWPDCKLGGNAFLIQVDGKDAIMTSAHQVLDYNTGETKNSCSKEQLKNAIYYFNASYMDIRNGKPKSDSVEMLSVKATNELPYNLNDRLNKPLLDNNDWLIINLDEQISTAKAPDGQVRGFIPFATKTTKTESPGYMIGFDPNFDKKNNGRISSYQKCDFKKLATGAIAHNCDSSSGSSSSLLGILEGEEIKVRAIHTRAHYKKLDDNVNYSLPQNADDWNVGVSIEKIKRELTDRYRLEIGS